MSNANNRKIRCSCRCSSMLVPVEGGDVRATLDLLAALACISLVDEPVSILANKIQNAHNK